jgi:hypothetical protein
VALFGKSEIKSGGGGKKKKKPTKGSALTSEQQQERERVPDPLVQLASWHYACGSPFLVRACTVSGQ